jgi:hypothetical protein
MSDPATGPYLSCEAFKHGAELLSEGLWTGGIFRPVQFAGVLIAWRRLCLSAAD